MLDHPFLPEARFCPLKRKLANECNLLKNHLEFLSGGNITILSGISLILAFAGCAEMSTYSFAGSQM